MLVKTRAGAGGANKTDLIVLVLFKNNAFRGKTLVGFSSIPAKE